MPLALDIAAIVDLQEASNRALVSVCSTSGALAACGSCAAHTLVYVAHVRLYLADAAIPAFLAQKRRSCVQAQG